MTDSARHPDAVDLAEFADGLLDPSRRQAIEAHVRDCAVCTGTLAELAALPRAMARAPVPPLPDDVAARLDEAIAAESTTRGSEWSGTAAQVTPIRRARRWLAPLASAAVIIAAVALVVPAIDSGQDNAGSGESAASPRDSGGKDAALSGVPSQGEPATLTSKHFGREVIDTYYSGSNAVRIASQLTSVAVDGPYRAVAESVPGLCAVASGSSVPHGQVDAITFDGESARLLRRDKGTAVDVIAFACDDNQPSVLDAVTLRRG